MYPRQRFYNHPVFCEQCSKTFYASRYDAKYCSAKCRAAAKKERDAIARAFEKLVNAYDLYSELLRANWVIPADQVDDLCRIRNSLNYFWENYNRAKHDET